MEGGFFLRVHIFVDAENVNPKLFKLSYAELKLKYDIVRIDIFSKESSLPTMYEKYNSKKFNIIKCFYGKNSADTFMTSYIVRAVYEEALTDYFAILTQDRDFAPAIKVVTDNNKYVILVTEENKIINNLISIGVNMKYFTNTKYSISKTKEYKKATIPKTQQKHIVNYDTSRTIFIKNAKNQIIEAFFNNGMEFSVFLNTLAKANIDKIKQGYSKSTKLTDILKDSFLVVKDGKIYCDMERILQ